MKIKKAISLCKQRKCIYLIDKSETQWLGDGCSLYPLLNMPYLNSDNIFTVMDIEEKKKEDYFLKHIDSDSEEDYSSVLEDNFPNEKILERMKIRIFARGHTMIPLKTSNGIIFIDEKYLMPLVNYFDTLELYERVKESGVRVIAAKTGLLLMSIIMPLNIIDEGFVEELKEITERCLTEEQMQ